MKNTNCNNNETITAMSKFEIIELVKDCDFEDAGSEFQKRYSEEVADFIKENSISDEDLKKLNSILEVEGLSYSELLDLRDELYEEKFQAISEFNDAISEMDFDKDMQIVLDSEGFEGAVHEIIYQMGVLLQNIHIDREEDEEDFDPIDEYLSKAIKNAAEICQN